MEPVAAFETAHKAYASGKTRSLAWRRDQLQTLDRMLEENKSEVTQALYEDLHKSPTEAALTEIGVVRGEIKRTLRKLSRWTRPRHVAAPAAFMPATAKIVPEPLGTMLIIAPWNYPVHLLLVPFVGAIAAGNAVVVKPSELAPATSHVMGRLIPQYMDRQAVQVVEGGVAETTSLLERHFDRIVFTGNGRVGRIVMEAAAKNLTPVTLELGGKSPVWFSDTEHIDQAAGRIAWGKFINAGQTCVAPDYILTTPENARPLAAALQRAIIDRWGTDARRSPDFARIINAKQFDRLVAHLPPAADSGSAAAGFVGHDCDATSGSAGEESADKGAVKLLYGGEHDRGELYIAPTILLMPASLPGQSLPPTPEQRPGIMQEEIFGPILPIVTVPDLDAAIAYITGGDKPLALYSYAATRAEERRLQNETSSGAMAMDASTIHVGAHTLPFGGVGESGMGRYHGKYSFEEFSHVKPVLKKPLVPDTLRLVQPPITDVKKKLMKLVGGE